MTKKKDTPKGQVPAGAGREGEKVSREEAAAIRNNAKIPLGSPRPSEKVVEKKKVILSKQLRDDDNGLTDGEVESLMAASVPRDTKPVVEAHLDGVCLPQYVSHKVVGAAKIIGITPDETGGGSKLDLHAPGYAVDLQVGYLYMEKHQPYEGGYYVVYEDGYESFSPAGPFESGYTPVQDTRGELSDDQKAFLRINDVCARAFTPDQYDEWVRVRSFLENNIPEMGKLVIAEDFIGNSKEAQVGKVLQERSEEDAMSESEYIFALGDTIRRAFLKHGMNSWLSVGRDVHREIHHGEVIQDSEVKSEPSVKDGIYELLAEKLGLTEIDPDRYPNVWSDKDTNLYRLTMFGFKLMY